jgi:tRNA pseudouridine synthase 9
VTLRKVIPYVFKYDSIAKGRWLGRTVNEMFLNEFGANSPAYYATCIRNGLITVNHKPVPDNGDYLIKNGDLITHAAHR